MKNIYDFFTFYGNQSFYQFPFSDVDGLILSLLSYAKLDGIVPSNAKSISMLDACTKYLEKYSLKDAKKEDWLFPIAYHLMEHLKESVRYQKARLSYFVRKTDKLGQFGAITIHLPNGITYISFEGTDSDIIGWKEDLEMVYQFPVQSQVLAKDYFNSVLHFRDHEVYVGGHSKGGNLAMYAYMYGKQSLKKRVKNVYNFDGPGFLLEVVSSSLYEEMSSKLKMFVPKDSVVGLSLHHGNYQVVNSSNIAIFEHDATSWEVFGGCFVLCELSKKSKRLEANLQEYIDHMSVEDRKNFVETFFAVFEKSEITNIMQLKDFKISTLLSIMKEIQHIPNKAKRDFVAIIRLLITGMNS